ncbi:MAG: hypothetical protein ACYDG2_09840 [Ruminiclostridium sp.]
MELLKGFSFTNPSFLVPVIVGIVLLFIIVKVAKSLFKFALLIAVIALVAILYINAPKFEIHNGTATLDLYGKQHSLSIKDAKVVSEDKNGEKQTVLITGTERINLPFSKSFADKFIMEKLNKAK